MRRLLSIAVVGVAALLPLSAHAQMRGGTFRGPVAPRMSSGFRSAQAGGIRTFAPAQGRVFMGSPVRRPGRVFMNRPFAPSGRMVRNRFAPSGRRFTINPFFHSCGGFFPCNNRFGFRHRFHKRFFFGTGFFPGSFFGASFFPGSFFPFSYIPGFDYDLEYPAYQAEAQPQPVSSDNSADVQVAVQLQRLSDEVEELQEQQQRAKTHAEARQPLPPGTSMSAVTPSASTIFVFRDGSRLTAQNYAIAGDTLWIVNEHAAKKMSLSDLDRAATEQANAANGLELRLPPAGAPK